MIQENREAVHRSHAASEDETLKDLEKLEKRMFSVEKTVGLRTPAGEWNLNPVAQLSDRASSSVVNANFRELNLKIEKALLEHEKFAKWASESIGGINEEQTLLANRMSRLQSGRGSQAIPPPGPGHPGGGQGPAGPVEGLLPGDTQVEHPGSVVVLLMLMELGTISVVPVSVVLPTEVALVTKGLALALVSLAMLQVTPQVLRAVVTLGQVLASATV